MNTKSIIPVFAAVTAVLFFALAARAAEPIRFTGRNVDVPESGITIIGKKDLGVIGVCNQPLHYILFAPYAEDWTFWQEPGFLLRGNAGKVNLTLSAERNKETPTQRLERQKKDVERRQTAMGIQNIELVTHKDEPILRYGQDAATVTGHAGFKGVKIHHFFAAKRRGDFMYIIHLSKVVGPEGTLDENEFRKMVTVGFHVDFMLDSKGQKTQGE